MTILGVDVASFQGTIDWPKVKASGIRFAIARCVREGDFGVDASYARNVAGARAAGITPGAYCFLSGSGRAATQASLFIRTIGDPTGMLIALDVEKGALTPTAADVRTFASAWRAVHPDHPLLIYGSRGATLGGLGTLADLGPLWLAAYPRIDHASAADLYTLSGGAESGYWTSTFGGWKGPAIWQFASTGVVPGISGSVDVDAIETADLAALTGSTAGSTGGTDVSIATAGVKLTSDHVATFSAATPYLDAPAGASIGAGSKIGYILSYIGDSAGFAAVIVTTGLMYPDRVARPTIVYVPRSAVTVTAAPVVATPADTSPFTQADVDAKVKAAVDADRARAHVTWQA